MASVISKQPLITLFKLAWVASSRRLVSAEPHRRRGVFAGKQRALSGEDVRRVPRVRAKAPPRSHILSFFFSFLESASLLRAGPPARGTLRMFIISRAALVRLLVLTSTTAIKDSLRRQPAVPAARWEFPFVRAHNARRLAARRLIVLRGDIMIEHRPSQIN